MLAFIRGQLVSKTPPEVVVDVGGVGYEIQVPMTTLYQLPELGQEVTLLTHFVVREDAQQLFGFCEQEDRRLFRELIKVSGVGPRLALTLLSGMDARAFARCLQRDDIAALVALPGVGKKTAERLVVEMRDKAGKWLETLSPEVMNAAQSRPVEPEAIDYREEAEQALVALGYKLAEAARWVASVDHSDIDSSAELIRLALKAAAPRSAS